MKLNKLDKACIVNKILQDVPVPKHEETKAALQERAYKLMSPKFRKLAKSGEGKFLLHTSVQAWNLHLDHSVNITIGDANLEDVIAPFVQQHKEYADLKAKLHAALAGVNTRKQAVDKFPEFVPYLPPEEGTTPNLPAVANVIADLLKHGWNQKVSKA